MSSFHQLLSFFTLSAVGVFVLVGCSREPAGSSSAPAAIDTAADVPSPSDVPEAFADLDEVDRAAAMAQQVCPVSGEELGSMGTPIKVTVQGRDVFLCCAGCKDKLLADPDTYLAKLVAE